MLIISQMRDSGVNALDINKLSIERSRQMGDVVDSYVIVASTWDLDRVHRLGTYDTMDEAKEALKQLALAWESCRSYFMQ